jgi:coenzyme F420-reducing hydrogenase delta subunit
MVPRPEGGRHPTVAQIDPDKCVGCGICAGSCNSAGIGLPWLGVNAERRRVEALVEASGEKGRFVAFVCGESARVSELPGYEVVPVPCAGWVHALSVERLLRRGVPGVLIVACGPGSCVYREGPKWTRQRLAAERDPKLRVHKVSPDRVRVLELYRHESAKLADEARRFRAEHASAATVSRSPRQRAVAGLALAATLALAAWGVTRIGYAAPALDQPELVVSFKHPGQNAEQCREPSAEELAKAPVHMRPKKICERRRADVRLRVHVDGRKLVDRAYEPRGIWHDGNSIAIERIVVPEGEHAVRVEVGDTADGTWPHRAEERVRFEAGRRRVVLFDKLSGFRWFQ